MLTQLQHELLTYITRDRRDTGSPPSIEEMRLALKLKSRSSINRLIAGLEDRGFVSLLQGAVLDAQHRPEIIAPADIDSDATPHTSRTSTAEDSELPLERCVTGQRILVVDDVTDVLVSVSAFLAGAGFAVVTATDGDAALHLIDSDPLIGVLITDFLMPELSGVELIARAVRRHPDLKALLITGYPGADGLADLPPRITVLTKPFRRAALVERVNILVNATWPMRAGNAPELAPGEKA